MSFFSSIHNEVTNTPQRPPARKRPGMITTLSVVFALIGILYAGFIGIGTIITRKMLLAPQPLQVSVVDYFIKLLPSLAAQVVFSILIGIVFIVLAWGLSMLQPWSYWVTLVVVLPMWMIYDLSKTVILLFHVLPATLFENPDIYSSLVPFIIELVIFLFIARKSIRNVFYFLQVKY